MTVFTLRLVCPNFKTQADIHQMKSALLASPGYASAETDVASHVIIVTTVSQDAGKDVVRRLTDAGFPPSDVEIVNLASGERTDTSE